MPSEQPKGIFFMIVHIIIKYWVLIHEGSSCLFIVIFMTKQVGCDLFCPLRKQLQKEIFHSHIYYLYILKFLYSVWFLDIAHT